MCTTEQKPLFRDLTAEDPEPEVTEIESLCMNCHSNGKTRLLLTRIPHYKNVVLMSFSCEECGFENNEIQPGGAYADLGVRWKLQVQENIDLNRQVVKSDHTSIRIPELDFEIPAQSQKGEVTTVEGIIARAMAGLSQDQETRRREHPDAAAQIDAFLERLQALKTLQTPWTLQLEDISGNCFVENPVAPRKDPRCDRHDFKRNKEEDHKLGIFTQEELNDEAKAEPEVGSYDCMVTDEVLQFRTNCPDCNAPADTNMKLTKIPHFKEVVIMATVCDACGHRTNEVKSGSGVEPRGVRYELRVAGRADFSRDVLKSDTCALSVPELDLEVGGRALGGRFTTAEGLLRGSLEQLRDSAALTGDAPALADPQALTEFTKKIEEVLDGKRAVTIVLDDPAGNSYVQALTDDPKDDDGLKVTWYERSYEQNDELGLNDINVDNYS
ncbi:zinc finger protein ZPR1 [Aricia agestis]|uniref:zinc finger protein ZPR1 n=1 Tax=Aricia agestis TaxID=91739 RepID=UPI001C201EB7|nr:zinc finger protein ZPR1 [Aricia agestis]